MPSGFRALWLPRRGNSLEEYEDAFAADAAAGRYAVADGATESCFAGPWARLLAKQFVERAECPPEQWTQTLPALQGQWHADFGGRTLPWYAEAGVAQGAFAAFLGVALKPGPDASWHWQAVAVGDTCLFHTNRGALLKAFPLEQSAQFNNCPKLLGSRTPPDELCRRQTLWADGRGQARDRLWMMTDALAQWCLREHEAGRNPWRHVQRLLARPDSQERFASWIERLRDTRRLRNDDVTLLALEL